LKGEISPTEYGPHRTEYILSKIRLSYYMITVYRYSKSRIMSKLVLRTCPYVRITEYPYIHQQGNTYDK